MKRLLIALLFTGLMCPTVVLAGGIVTNANQSASYVRMLARDASTSIDAVYYNPAGLTKLADGFHLSLSNQAIFQKKTIENKYVKLKDGKYNGDVVAPVFPDIYAVYKKNKIALGFGLQPNAGGGSANYATGLPSFEIPVSIIPSSLTLGGIPTSDYSADITFKGSSVFWGAQVNASYAITEMVSLSAGVRMIYAKNTYNGYLKNIMINPKQTAFGASYNGINMVSANQFFTDAATTLNGWSSLSTTTASDLTSGIGAGTYTAGTLVNDLTDPVLKGKIVNMFAAGGLAVTSTTNVGTAIGTLGALATGFTTNATKMSQNASGTLDKDVDAEQTGTGYTPILGANLTLGEKLNIGIKYEFKTTLTLKNKTKVDGTGLFADGAKFRNDIPAILSVGIGYKILPQLKVSSGVHYYFDKNATIEYFEKNSTTSTIDKKKKKIDGNLYEVAIGMEYDVTEKFLISAGYLFAKTGVGGGYQTDLSHSLTSRTVGFGGAFKVTEKMQLNLGMLYTMYTSDAKTITYPSLVIGNTTAKETYNRTNIAFSIGVDYSF